MIFNHFLIKAIENPPTKMTDSKINVMSNVVDKFGSITTRKRGRAHKRASLSSTFHSMKSSSCSCMYTATNIIIIILVSSDGCSLVNPRLIHPMPTGPTEKPILVFMAGTSRKEQRLNSTRRSRLTRPELPGRRKAGVISRNTRRTWSRIALTAKHTARPTTTRRKP